MKEFMNFQIKITKYRKYRRWLIIHAKTNNHGVIYGAPQLLPKGKLIQVIQLASG